MTERVKLFCYCWEELDPNETLTKVLRRPLQFVSMRNTFLLNPNYSLVSGSWRHFGKTPDIHQTTADGFLMCQSHRLFRQITVRGLNLWQSGFNEPQSEQEVLFVFVEIRLWDSFMNQFDGVQTGSRNFFPEKLWAQLMYVREEEEHPWGPGFPPECDWRLFSSLFPLRLVLLCQRLDPPASVAQSGESAPPAGCVRAPVALMYTYMLAWMCVSAWMRQNALSAQVK